MITYLPTVPIIPCPPTSGNQHDKDTPSKELMGLKEVTVSMYRSMITLLLTRTHARTHARTHHHDRDTPSKEAVKKELVDDQIDDMYIQYG